MKKLLIVLLSLAATLGAISCQKNAEEQMEEAGTVVEETYEEVSEDMGEAFDDMEEGYEEVEEDIEESFESEE